MKVPVLGEKTQILSEERKGEASTRLSRIDGFIGNSAILVLDGFRLLARRNDDELK